MADWERGGTSTKPPGGDQSKQGREEGSRQAGSATSAGATASAAAEQARAAAEQARAAASGVGETIRGTARELKEAATRKAEGRKDELAERVVGLAETMRRSAEDVRDRERWLSDLMERGSDELVRFADTVRSRDLTQLAGQVEDFARRQPALFLGASFAVGFALARVAKASAASERYGGSYAQQGYGATSASEQQPSQAGDATGSAQDATAATQVPPKGTELGAHVAGPAGDETSSRERVGAATPGATGSTVEAGGRAG